MSLGLTLRTAREAKGFTPSELASKTHMLIQIIEGLENEDFRRIPAPIYGRGFIKLYCENVGLDPKPLQDEFTALYAQFKNAPDKMSPPRVASKSAISPPPPRPQAAVPPPPQPEPVEPPPQPEPVEPPPQPEPVEPPPQQPELPTQPAAPETPLAHDEPPPVISEAPPRRSYGELFEQSYADDEGDRRSAAETFHDTLSNISSGVFSNVKKLPPKTGRIAIVAIGGLILLILIAWGIKELYSATTPQQPAEKPAANISETKQTPPAAKPAPAATKPAANAPVTRPATPKANDAKADVKQAAKPASAPATKPAPASAAKPATAPVAPAKPAPAAAKPTPTAKPSANAPSPKRPRKVKLGDLKPSKMETPSLYVD